MKKINFPGSLPFRGRNPPRPIMVSIRKTRPRFQCLFIVKTYVDTRFLTIVPNHQKHQDFSRCVYSEKSRCRRTQWCRTRWCAVISEKLDAFIAGRATASLFRKKTRSGNMSGASPVPHYSTAQTDARTTQLTTHHTMQ